LRLNQITVPSLDLEISIPFYKKLGLELIVHSNSHYARFQCPEGESTFSIHLVDILPQGDGIIIYFEIENLDLQINNLISKGIQIDEMPNDKPWLWREARLKDPYNNQIILFYGGKNRLNPPWKL